MNDGSNRILTMREAAVGALDSGSVFETLAVIDEWAAFPNGASPRRAKRDSWRGSFDFMTLPESQNELYKYGSFSLRIHFFGTPESLSLLSFPTLKNRLHSSVLLFLSR